MITICMAYHDREPQLLKTLESFQGYEDIEVIIVNDSEPLNLKEYNFPIEEIRVKNKTWINPGVNFNIGFASALSKNPDFVIIQNPECYHMGDIVGTVRQRLTSKNYISFACYSLGLGQDVDIKELNNRGAVNNGDPAWYNHSKHRPEAFHFCCALTAGNLRKINGFDENFANGLGYEDNYWIHQIKTLGLKIDIIDDPFVFHQYHYDKKIFDFSWEVYNRTKQLCDSLKKRRTYVAQHFITENL